MLILANTTDKVEIVLWSAVTTNELQFYASWRDITTTAIQPWRSVWVTNGTTDVDLIVAPSASTTRSIDYISVNNTDTVNILVIIKYSDNWTERVLSSCLLCPWDKIEYQEKKGIRVVKSSWWFLTELLEDSNVLSVSWPRMLVLKNDFLFVSSTSYGNIRVPEFDMCVNANTTYHFTCKIFFANSSWWTNSLWIAFWRNTPPSTWALYWEGSSGGTTRQFRHWIISWVSGFERNLGYINNTNVNVWQNFFLLEGFFTASFSWVLPIFLIKASTWDHTYYKWSYIRYTPVI